MTRATDTLTDDAAGPPSAAMTAAQLLRHHDPLDRRVELVCGRLVVSEPPGWPHGSVALRAGAAIVRWIDEVTAREGRRPGHAAGNDPGCWIERAPDTVRAPDVAYVACDRVPLAPENGFLDGAPSLAIEVLSPRDRRTAVREKIDQWLAAGTALVWTIDPERREARVHRGDGTVTHVGEDGTLDGEGVLPGFVLPLRTLFD